MVEKAMADMAKKRDARTTELDEKSMELHLVRHKLEHFRSAVVKDVEQRISGMIEEVLQEIRQHQLQTHEFRHFAHTGDPTNLSASAPTTWSNRVLATPPANDSSAKSSTQGSSKAGGKAGTLRVLPDKVFVTRESYLTALLEVAHMKTIYHIFYIILLVFLMNAICYDYFVEGRINFGLGTFRSGLQRIHYVFGVWLAEHLFVFALYYAVHVWARVRVSLRRRGAPGLAKWWSRLCLGGHVLAQLIFMGTACGLCLRWDLPFVTASVLLLESTRLLMKMHAFTRFNAARVIAGKPKTERESPKEQNSVWLPSFGQYLYFLFAPTLIYRDAYPRTSQIRWRFAFARFLEVVAIAFLYAYIHERHLKVHFQNYGREELSEYSIIVKLSGMFLPSTIIFLCGFYMILHSWLNFTSELLRFGDRMFYKDWWTSHTYDAYFRNWNVVVHDWLYEYIYKDFYLHVFKGSKLGSSLMVFFVSAVVHEQILGFALQVFFPVMFVLFGFVGVAMVFITRKASKNLGNTLLWFSLIVGNGAMISLYCMEYYARHNCPKDYHSWADYLTPAVWHCYAS